MTEVALKQVRSRAGPLQRVGAFDFSTAEEVLKTAALLVVPDDQTQRKAFEQLVPHLYVLRNKGCSWAQLTKLLGECGFKLQPSTVRSYFTEMLASRLDVCQSRMNEQIAIMAAVRNETAGVDLAAITSRVQSHMLQLKESARARIDAVFGEVPTAVVNAHPSPSAAPSPPQRPASDVRRPVPATPATDAPQNDERPGDYGPLGLPAAPAKLSDQPGGLSSMVDDTTSSKAAPQTPATRAAKPRQPRAEAPALNPAAESTPSAASTLGAGRKKVCSLHRGVQPLKRREGVPAAVYEEGQLEHPAIPGLMLTREQRVYGVALEYVEVDGPDQGEIKTETPDEKRFRVVWRKTVPMARTRTADSFTKMDTSIFKQD